MVVLGVPVVAIMNEERERSQERKSKATRRSEIFTQAKCFSCIFLFCLLSFDVCPLLFESLVLALLFLSAL